MACKKKRCKLVIRRLGNVFSNSGMISRRATIPDGEAPIRELAKMVHIKPESIGLQERRNTSRAPPKTMGRFTGTADGVTGRTKCSITLGVGPPFNKNQ